MLTCGLVDTALGQVALVYDPCENDTTLPILLCIHGFLRDAGALLHWRTLLAGEYQATFAEMPGHGRTPPEGDCSIAAMADRFRLAIQATCNGRDILVLGESTGGLVALALADGRLPQIRGVIAGDPPLTAAKQWTVQATAGQVLKNPHASPYLARFAEAVFGISAVQDQTAERIYYDLVAKASVPTLILTGDVPLWPVRTPKGVPCLIDEVDILAVETMGNPHVRVHQIVGCGHLVLANDAGTPVDLVRGFCREALNCRTEPPARNARMPG